MQFKLPKYLINFWFALTRQHSRLDRISRDFWASSDFTYLGGEAYYAKREAVLHKVLSKVGPVETAVDLGCGDGRFSLLIAEYADAVVGYDVSPALVRAARERAARDGVSGATFEVAELEQVPIEHKAALVACFGVVSCIHDDRKLDHLVRILCSLVESGGCLLLIDTLGRSQEITKAYRNGYVARYRHQVAYEMKFSNAGLSLLEKVEISKMAEKTVNNLYVFRRA